MFDFAHVRQIEIPQSKQNDTATIRPSTKYLYVHMFEKRLRFAFSGRIGALLLYLWINGYFTVRVDFFGSVTKRTMKPLW